MNNKLHQQAEQNKVHLLPLEAVISPQQPFILLMCTELDSSVRDDSHHRSGVPPPQTEEAILQVGAVDQLISFL